MKPALSLVLLVSLPLMATAVEPPGFWVWHRRDALQHEERDAVKACDGKLYWHVGEVALSDNAIRWRWRQSVVPEPGAVPVLRMDLTGRAPFDLPDLAKIVSAVADAGGRLQIDCDCPDRLLAQYAAFLSELHRFVPHLSATALGGWCYRPAFRDLQYAVESLAVMFYDLQPDPEPVTDIAPPLPLLEVAAFNRRLEKWNACGVLWSAGLPNFSRVTLYDATGRFKGHVRNWRWDELVFNPSLSFGSSPAPGVVLLRAKAGCTIADVPVSAGFLLAVRWPDCEVLTSATEMVQHSHASGVTWFRLPDSSDASGWSVRQLTNLKAAPDLVLRTGASSGKGEPDSLVLVNNSNADVPARIVGDGPGDRGYALEVDASQQIWREVLPGDFWRVGAHADPETNPTVAPIPFATRLTFWFSHLRAGENLKTGLIQLAPGASIRQIRYRILPGNSAWKTLD